MQIHFSRIKKVIDMKIIHLNLISKSIFIAFVAIVIISCNHSDETECIKCDTAPTIAKSELEYLGLTVPFSIQEMLDAPPVYTLGLSPNARVFSFNENVLNQALYDTTPNGRKINDSFGSKFLKLLKDNTPVKVYILSETTEVWWVETATEKELTDYLEATKLPKE